MSFLFYQYNRDGSHAVALRLSLRVLGMEAQPAISNTNRRKIMSTVLEHQLVLDCQNLLCPMPIIKLNAAINQIGVGQTLQMLATDPGSQYDVQAWAKQRQHELVATQKNGKVYTYVVRRAH